MNDSRTSPLAFEGWALRLARFADTLASSEGVQILVAFSRSELAGDRELEECEHSLGALLPVELKALFREAGRGIRFRYRWAIPEPQKRLAACGLSDLDALWGGPVFDLAELASLRIELREQVERSWVSGIGMEEERDFWLGSLPLMRLDNDDYLALALGEGSLSEVRYLSHEAPGDVLADSLSQFLEAWEQLGYLGPEIWMLEPFQKPETGRLDAGCRRAIALKNLFGTGIRPK